MSVYTKEHIPLKLAEKNIILQGEWLTDIHMDNFHRLLASCSDYRPVETWRIQCLHTIEPVLQDKKHIQILHSSSSLSDGHWVCSYYDKKKIFIYDSLNNKTLHKHHEQFLKRLFPTYNFEKNPVKFPTVQQQPNYSDCGVFAIAFAISLLFDIKPDKVKYEHKLMRSHLIKILETNIIEHFPQDPQYVAQKVLPLAVIKIKEAEAIRIRMIRQSETDQQKSSRLKKRRDNYAKKEFNKTQLTLQSTTKEMLPQNISNKIQFTQNEIIKELVNNIQIKQNNNNKCSKNLYQNLENNRSIQLTQNASKQIMEEPVSIETEQSNKNECLQNKEELTQNVSQKIMEELINTETDQNNKSKCLQNKDLFQEENFRAKKRRRYQQDLENNRAKKRYRYEQNLENNRAKQMQRYKKDLDNNRAKQMQRYKKKI